MYLFTYNYYFITAIAFSHFGQVRTHVDPRLLTKSVEDFPKQFGIQQYRSVRNSFNSLVKADKVLNDVNLSDKVVMITGGNSGLGKCKKITLQ